MDGGRREARDVLAALASPVSVAAVAVLALNDHVLKQAWPGVVTGKLSDVAGLVFAPFLVALPLALLRVRRPVPVAVVLTGTLFALVKGTTAGAALAGDAWGLVAGPSYVWKDPTDLLALPALLVALRAHRLARSSRLAGRSAVPVAVGAMLLPFVVVATGATVECFPSEGLTSLGVVRGALTAPDGTTRVESRILLGSVSIDASGRLRTLNEVDDARASDLGPTLSQVCDRASGECWRAHPRRPATVEHRPRGGSWAVDFALDRDQQRAVRSEVGEQCGDHPAPLVVRDLALLPTPHGPVVAAASSFAGLLLRRPDGRWQQILESDIAEQARPAPSPRPRDLLTPVEPTPSPPSPPSPRSSRSPRPTGPPSRSCASPSTRTVTPDPRNGPPTTYPVCPPSIER